MTTDAEVLNKLLHRGGRILVVGGGLSDFPDRFKNHPGIMIWDDDRQGIQNREIPSNTRAVLYSRWISHPMAAKIGEACKSLGIPKFPMLRNREIKQILDQIIQSDEPVTEPTIGPSSIVEIKEPIVQEPVAIKETEMPIAKGRLSVKDFVKKNLDYTKDYTVKGKISAEGERLFKLAKQEGVQTTILSLKQCVGQTVKGNRPKKVKTAVPVVTVKPTSNAAMNGNDQFAELEKLVADAMAAMSLIQEQIVKIRDSENVRFKENMKEKLLQMFN